MKDRSGIFAGSDPFALIRDWLEVAQGTEPNDPNAMALATVDADGLPNNRMVLLKEIETDAIVFYTNYQSKKGRELSATPKAAVVLHWKSLRRQIRLRGDIERVGGQQADRYFESRSPLSRIGARASQQSTVIESRAVLEGQVEQVRQEFGEAPPRPDFWGGFRLRPIEIEFWADGEGRLHDRFRWSKQDETWQIDRLSP